MSNEDRTVPERDPIEFRRLPTESCRQKVQTNGFIPFHQRVIHRTHTGFRSTDPYVDDIQNALSGKTAPSAVADLVGKIKHPIALDQNR